MLLSPEALAEELEWLKANPAFEERPATLNEFLGPDYLNIEGKVRERIRAELVIIMGEKVSGTRPTVYPYAMMTGAIGIGKTTIASIVLPYLAHWVLCLKDPQGYFDLLPGSRIAFMQMSTSEKQALEVVFGDIKARIQHSPWFHKYPYDTSFKNQIRFPKEIWIIPGDSHETTFEGYNILGGILDEADSHVVTATKDYAEIGYSTIESRITSRFGDKGFLIVIGQMKRTDGFASKKYREFCERADAYAVRLAIWDSFGWDYYKDADGVVKFFYYDTSRRQIVPNRIAEMVGAEGRTLLKIPEVYRASFVTNPEKAMRDLAGMPTTAGDPFIGLPDKVYAARDRWVKRYGIDTGPVDPGGVIATWFMAKDGLKRVVHVDVAYSEKGDALGMVMGHVREVVEIDGEMKPYIVIDLMYREKALPGREIFLGKIRQIIYALKRSRRFKITKVTTDGFQSTDFRQQMQKNRFEVDVVSVDKDMLPYSDLRDALYEDRIDMPPYLVDLIQNDGTRERVDIAMKEIIDLKDTGKKVDHPDGGSKDVADAVAGVVFTLMGDRRYHRKVRSLDEAREQKQERMAVGGFNHPAYLGDRGITAPVSPVFPTGR